MEAKEIVSKKPITDKNTKRLINLLIIQVVYFLLGLLISRGAVLGDLSPFGISFVCAVPFTSMIPSIIGASVGYILLNPIDGFRYMAMLIALGAIRWLLNDLTRINRSKFFAPIIAFIPVTVTGIALISVRTSEKSGIAICIIEGILAAAAAFFFKETILLFTSKRALTSFSQQETACMVMSGCIGLLCLGSMEFYGISVGRILSVVIILICAKYGSVSGGSIAGVATGVVFGLSTNNFAFICGCYGFGGLLAGLFSPVGKIACALTFFVSDAIMAFGAVQSDLIYSVVIESVIGGVVFLFLPKVVGNAISAIFVPSEDNTKSEALKRSLISRLGFASKALNNVSDCVNGVSEKLKKMYDPQFNWVYENTYKKVCTGCGLRVFCHESKKEITADDFSKLGERVIKNSYITENDIEELFVKKCCKQREIAQSINDSYKDYIACEEAQRRITQVRSVVAGQFSGLSEILDGFANEFTAYTAYNTENAIKITEALNRLGIIVINCSCPTNAKNVMTVEIEALAGKGKIIKSQVLREVCNACGRIFNAPSITYLGESLRIVLTQRPTFDVEIGTYQHIARDCKLCGDCLNYFNNGSGEFVALISDGMGTGGRAAVDSNMTSSILTKLCKAGISYESAIKIVNSALMIKSEDESLSTIDLLSIDLYNGKATIMKAGSAVTYFKKNSKIIKIDLPSLPVGILGETQFVSEDIYLSAEDCIVMISDGIITEDEKWLENLIKGWNEASAQDLAQAVVSEAMKRRESMHDDDMTAIAIKMVTEEN